MFAAVVGGIYPAVEEAQKKMNSGFIKEYSPIQENSAKYDKIYKKYRNLGRFIEGEIMKDKS